jgi:hypothetical protein
MWVRIVDGEVTELGPLPASSARLDTGHPVLDLAGSGAGRQRACGWYDLDDVDPDALPLTSEQREQIAAAIEAARNKRQQRLQWLQTQSEHLADVQSYASDWIDGYGSGTPPIPGYPNPGQLWPAASTAERVEALRRMTTVNAFANVRLANLVEVLYRLLLDALADNAVEIPDL